jgi:hypothetical protein
MEFRVAVGLLVEAADKRASDLHELMTETGADPEDEAAHEEYKEQLAEVEEAICAGRLYLERTPA